MSEDCIFCKIVNGEIPCHKIWEDEDHLAFLSIFPNTDGFTVVIPKDHQGSYFAEVPEKIASDLFVAAKKVAKILDEGLEDVGRTGLIFEGFGVNHLHAKLFPMHGTADTEKWREIKSTTNKFFEKYEGYIASNDSERADEEKLKQLADKIKNNKP